MDDNKDDLAGQVEALIRQAGAGCPFGPPFFAGQLGALVRERCPTPEEGLPNVQVFLNSGEQLNLCHVIGFAPLWVGLAVFENDSDSMRTELVPYESIMRVTIGPPKARGTRVGFDHSHAPAPIAAAAMTPEQALRAAAAHGEDP